MSTHYTDKIIIVTGGTSGIGAELVRQLSEAGAYVYAVSRSKPTKPYPGVQYRTHDLAEAEQAEALYDEIVTRHDHVDYVFNCAGSFVAGEVLDTPLDDWHLMVRNNTLTVMNSCHYAYRQMAEQGYGHIINVGSSAGLFPVPGMGVYGASKYAVTGLTAVLRTEAKKYGVRVSLASPTIVRTPLYDKANHYGFNYRRALEVGQKYMQTPERAAERILRGAAKNKAVITTAPYIRFTWLFYRYLPWLYGFGALLLISQFRKRLKASDT